MDLGSVAGGGLCGGELVSVEQEGTDDCVSEKDKQEKTRLE